MVRMRYFYLEGGRGNNPTTIYNRFLHSNEIELYARNGVNVALNKTAIISSQYSNFSANLATNGNNGVLNYFHTGYTDIYPYIEIDLGSIYDITKITIYNEYGNLDNSCLVTFLKCFIYLYYN